MQLSKNKENLYKHLRFCLIAFKAIIRNIPGIKYNTNGINSDVPTLINESLKR